MIAEELVPFIDERYRTMQSYQARAITGPDLAGYSAIYTAVTHPGTFGFVAGQSTHLFGPLGGEDLIRQIRKTPNADTRFLLIWGKYDIRGRGVQRRPGMMDWRKDSRDFLALLQSLGWSAQGREVSEGWGWSSWRNSFEDVLEWFLRTPVQ
jgi:enterochelin esterase-like enzyme